MIDHSVSMIPRGINSLLITGGTGFFGKSILRHLVAARSYCNNPIRVVVMSRDPGLFLSQNPEFVNLSWLQVVPGDILRPETLPRNTGFSSFTHIIHAAADSTLGPRLMPLERYQQIVDGTRHLLDYAVQQGVGRFLLTSSGAVYGKQAPDLDRMPEDLHTMPDPLDVNQAYGIAKRCAEHLCAQYQQQYGLPVVIARCFAFSGRDLPLDVHFAIGNFVRDALYADAIRVAGDGNAIRTYMDQRDLAEWLLSLLLHGQAGQAYNVGGEVPLSIRELAELVRDTLAPHKPVQFGGGSPGSAIAQHRNIYVPCVQKARSKLGLGYAHSLTDSLLDMALHAPSRTTS